MRPMPDTKTSGLCEVLVERKRRNFSQREVKETGERGKEEKVHGLTVNMSLGSSFPSSMSLFMEMNCSTLGCGGTQYT